MVACCCTILYRLSLSLGIQPYFVLVVDIFWFTNTCIFFVFLLCIRKASEWTPHRVELALWAHRICHGANSSIPLSAGVKGAATVAKDKDKGKLLRPLYVKCVHTGSEYKILAVSAVW